MARIRKAEPPPKPKAIAASAKRMRVEPGKPAVQAQSWQQKAYEAYSRVPEYRAGINWVANVVSRASLYATEDTGDGPQRVAPGSEADLVLDEFFGGRQGQAQMLRLVAMHYGIAGEAWIVGAADDDDNVAWNVYAVTQVKQQGSSFLVGGVVIPDDATVIRIWLEDPANPSQADSPSRAVLPVLQEIMLLDGHINASLTSRLASAGVLLFPNEIAALTSTREDPDGNPIIDSSASGLVELFQDVAERAIANRDDPSAIVPIILTADGEHLPNIRHMTFWSELSTAAPEMREKAVRRLALGMDMPPEQLTGVGDTSHWNAWQIDESAIKSHTEPLLARITYDFTVGYLRPAMPEGTAQQYGIAADTSEMRLRPNRSKEALELYDRGELNPISLRRETGFDEGDAMDRDAQVRWLLHKMASGSTTPEIVVKAAELLGVAGLEVAVPDAEPTEARPTRSLEDHPTQDPPEAPAIAASAAIPDDAMVLFGLAEGLVFRALQRAGNRLRNQFKGGLPEDVQAMEAHCYVAMNDTLVEHALTDAWTDVPGRIGHYGIDGDKFVASLDTYCRGLLKAQAPHDPRLLARHLSRK